MTSETNCDSATNHNISERRGTRWERRGRLPHTLSDEELHVSVWRWFSRHPLQIVPVLWVLSWPGDVVSCWVFRFRFFAPLKYHRAELLWSQHPSELIADYWLVVCFQRKPHSRIDFLFNPGVSKVQPFEALGIVLCEPQLQFDKCTNLAQRFFNILGWSFPWKK